MVHLVFYVKFFFFSVLFHIDRRRVVFLLDTQVVGGRGRVPFSVVNIVSTVNVKFAQGMQILVAKIFN